MNDKLRYEKVKSKNNKLTDLNELEFDINEPSDILVNGLGFVRITKVGKIKIDVKDMNIDTLSLSGHKINAPKGVKIIK